MRMSPLFFLFLLAASTGAFAQSGAGPMVYRTPIAGPGIMVSASETTPRAPVLNEPYSATVAIETIQNLSDGNRIIQHLTGAVARDSQGRTRREIPVPSSPSGPPRIVLIQDPVAGVAYRLNLTSKTAQKIPLPSVSAVHPANGARAFVETGGFSSQTGQVTGVGPVLSAVLLSRPGRLPAKDKVTSQHLGSETIQGLLVNGTRTTETIPPGQIGNAKPITIVTETWTSPDLQTVVYRKTNDPLTGEQIYRLTNISRSEPDPSQFAVPSNFQWVQGPSTVVIRRPRSRN